MLFLNSSVPPRRLGGPNKKETAKGAKNRKEEKLNTFELFLSFPAPLRTFSVKQNQVIYVVQ